MQSKNDSQAQQISSTPDDDQLISRGLRGDPDALETLFARHNRALYQTALRVLGNPEDAQDALQEGLLAAYRNLRRFEGRSQFSTWLTRIVINAALMRRRSQRARPAVSLDEPSSPNCSKKTWPASRRCCVRRICCARSKVSRPAKPHESSALPRTRSRHGCGGRASNSRRA